MWWLIHGLFCYLAVSLQSLLGENRQRYLDRLKERLARREKRMAEGLDPDEEDEEALRLMEEEENKSSGNILRDLQNRFDDEKDALLRRLRVRCFILISHQTGYSYKGCIFNLHLVHCFYCAFPSPLLDSTLPSPPYCVLLTAISGPPFIHASATT